MRTVRTLIAAATLLLLAACGTNNTLPEPTITGVTPTEVQAGTEITITGSNYYAVQNHANVRVEACGVTVPATLVNPVTRSILLPPGSEITAQVGTNLTAELPEDGFTTGLSDVRVIRPDGSTAVLENAVTCSIPAEEPEPEPTPVSAVLNSSSTVGVAPAVIEFNATGSTGEGELEFAWDFGVEDAASTETAPTYEYTEAGSFAVTLTVTDEAGATATATETITVHPALQAVIHRSGVTGHAPVTIHFYGTSSTGIAPLTYSWDFGDHEGTSSEAEPSYEYQDAGTYTVFLIVTDANGETSTTTTDVIIPRAPTRVNAVITAEPTAGITPLTVSFSALDSTGEGELTFEWDFGDETGTSTDAEPTYTFTAVDTYDVTLTVTDELGETDQATKTVHVNPLPATLDFTAEPVGLGVTATAFVVGDNYSGSVSLPGGSLSDLPPGDYTITTGTINRTHEFSGHTVLSTWSTAPQTITLTEGEARTVALSFEPEPGALDVSDTGLPEGWDYTDSDPELRALNTPYNYDLHGDTSDWSQLVPGVYELRLSDIRIDHGHAANNTDWSADYVPLSPITLAISSNEITEHEIEYTITPAGNFSLGGTTGLPADLEPAVRLVRNVPPFAEVDSADWGSLLPGQYSLFLDSVDYVDEDGILLPNASYTTAYRRYEVTPDSRSYYLSSNEDLTTEVFEYTAIQPRINISINSATGDPVDADVRITDASGNMYQFTSAMQRSIDVPFGEYTVSISEPEGYRIASGFGSTTPGLYVADTSLGYPDRHTPYEVFVTYEPAPAAPEITTFEATSPVILSDAATFTWAVSNPQGDALTCTFQPTADATPVALDDCLSGTIQHTYASVGEFEATFTVHDEHNNTVRATQVVHVDLPVAPSIESFEVQSPVVLRHRNTVTWEVNNPHGGPLTCTFTSGEGNAPLVLTNCDDRGRSFSYEYANVGTYTATLTVQDEHNDAVTETVTVEISSPTPTVTEFTTNATNASPIRPGEEVTFEWIIADHVDELPHLTCELHFGDGTSEPVTCADQQATHTYASPNNYAVSLHVTNQYGVTIPANLTAYIKVIPPAPVIERWHAFLEYDDPNGEEVTVTFDVRGRDATGPVTCSIDFGDTTSPRELGDDCVDNTRHTISYSNYEIGETYDATLTITDTHGNQVTDTIEVNVTNPTPPVIHTFETNPEPPIVGDYVTFTWAADADSRVNSSLVSCTLIRNGTPGEATLPCEGGSLLIEQTELGEFTYTFTITDSYNPPVTREHTFTVLPAPPPFTASKALPTPSKSTNQSPSATRVTPTTQSVRHSCAA